MEKLVTDRSAADLALLEALLEKGQAAWTAAETMYFFHGAGDYGALLTAEGDAVWTETDAVEVYAGDGVVRGAYNATDLNRVTAAMEELHARLTACGYWTGYTPVVLDGGRVRWCMEDIPTREQMEGYLANVRRLREVLDVPAGTPAAPADMEGLTLEEANHIERILERLDAQLTIMAETWIPCGEAVCGGENL